MRSFIYLLGSTALAAAMPVHAADTLKFGPAPSWVVPQSIPDKSTNAANAPAALLLTDEQVRLEPGKSTSFEEVAVKLQSPDGLSAGNITFPWNPAFDTITVNKLHIIRGGKVIDVLGGGQTFTVARRETNLDAATLDGTLTAALQPEDLQVGDIVDFAMTMDHSDPTLKNHVEGTFGGWNAVPIELGHVRISWPAGMAPVLRESGNLPAARQFVEDGRHVFELTAHAIEPPVPPKSAPVRYRIGRLGQVSDFKSWADLADLFKPLYQNAAVIPASGPLRDELESIRKQAHTPKERAELALQLVENRVRYVALAMGTGGLVPASAETTWARRFGDCKAKTALLLALFHELGIQAEPVLADFPLGDSVAERLPMAEDFDHAIVRARIDGKDYWLDGTRTGDTDLDSIPVPNFGWVLPLTANASLVHLVPPPLTQPSAERHVAIDASGGLYAPASVTIEEIYRGDSAVALNTHYSGFSTDQRDEALREEARTILDTFAVNSSSVQYDKDKREFDVTIKGTARLNWKDGWAFVPTSTIAFDPDFDRPAGPLHDVPVEIGDPKFAKDVATIRLPPGVAAQEKLSTPVHQTLAGVDYERSETVSGDVLTVESSERSLVPEVPYGEAVTAAPRIKALFDDDVYLNAPTGYHGTAQDLSALADQSLNSADDYIRRANTYLTGGEVDEAIADYSQALKLDPYNDLALADRALAYISKHDYQKADSDLSAVEAKDPNNSILLRARGFEAETRHDVPGEIQLYTRALQRDPGNVFALDHRGEAYYRDWQQDNAISDLTEALKKSPKDVMALSYRGLAEIEKGEYEAAQADAAAAKLVAPQDPSVLYLEASLAEHRGDSSAEIAAYSKLIESSPDKADAYAHRANVYLSLHRFSDVLADTEHALKLGYKSTDLHLARANAFMELGNRDGVAAEAEEMTKEAPDSAYAFVAAAKSYAALGQRDRAMQALARALTIEPDAVVYINRATVRPFTDIDGRIADLDAALKLEPNNVAALTLKGRQLVLKGDYPSALQVYERAARLAPDDSGVALGRALALFRSGRQNEAEQVIADRRSKAITADDFRTICWAEASDDMFVQQALKDCERAQQLDPKTALNAEGVAFLRLGLLENAIREFGKSIAQEPTAFAYMGRAIAYARAGDGAHARADRAEALELDPDEEVNFAEYGLKFDDSTTPAKPAAATTAAK